MNIDRCYCFQQTFSTLKELAGAHGVDTVAALQEHVTFGQQCKLCHPYVRRMLRTGETVFGEIVTEADEPPPSLSGSGTRAAKKTLCSIDPSA